MHEVQEVHRRVSSRFPDWEIGETQQAKQSERSGLVTDFKIKHSWYKISRSKVETVLVRLQMHIYVLLWPTVLAKVSISQCPLLFVWKACLQNCRLDAVVHRKAFWT